MKRTLALIVLGAAIGSAGCSSDDSSGSGPDRAYSATIVRTTYGIPHVTGSDFGNLGYGLGYSYAQDNFCVLMREIVVANGNAARYWGEDHANDDFVFSWANSDEFIANEFLPAASDDVRELAKGYAAGFNRHLEETGVANLAEGPEGCRDEEWVRPITDLDVAKELHKLIVLAGLDASIPGGRVTDLIMAGSANAPSRWLVHRSLAPKAWSSTPAGCKSNQSTGLEATHTASAQRGLRRATASSSGTRISLGRDPSASTSLISPFRDNTT